MLDPITETRQTYDVIAGEYARRKATTDPQLLAELDALGSLAHASLVADVGCGPGRETALLREQGLRVVGLDLSIGQLRAGQLSGMVQADMRHLPLRAASLDAIWCLAAMLHIPRETVPAVLSEFARAVRSGGELYLVVAEGDGQNWEAASSYGSSRRRWYTYHRQPDLAALLVTAGFEVRKVRRSRTNRDWLALYSRRVGTRR